MTELPDEERLALLFQVVGGLSYREISEALECPIGTVMSRIHRAKRWLRHRLAAYARNYGIMRTTPLKEERGMPKLNCQEAQNLLEAFHDNELDGVTSLSVQEHLDECPDCRRQWRWLCEVEASLQRLIESVPSSDQDLRRHVLRPKSRLAGPVLALFRTHRRLAGVVSLALLFALGAIVLLTERTGADVMLFVRDSVKMAQYAASLELRTSNTEEAEQWLKQQMGFAPTVRNPSGFTLVGAGSCHINSEPVGLLVFERDGQRLSCYVSRSSMTALRGFDDATPEGIRLGTCEGRQVAAWDAGNVSYLLVADLTKDLLLAVADEVANGASQSLKQ